MDSKAGERLVFKRRADAAEDDSPLKQRRQRLRLVVDISGSMTRFNSYDGRLNRSLEVRRRKELIGHLYPCMNDTYYIIYNM